MNKLGINVLRRVYTMCGLVHCWKTGTPKDGGVHLRGIGIYRTAALVQGDGCIKQGHVWDTVQIHRHTEGDTCGNLI